MQNRILDGKTGKPLLSEPIKSSVGAQASPISISMEGRGHDLFLYWIADCTGHEGEGGSYKFVNGEMGGGMDGWKDKWAHTRTGRLME